MAERSLSSAARAGEQTDGQMALSHPSSGRCDGLCNLMLNLLIRKLGWWLTAEESIQLNKSIHRCTKAKLYDVTSKNGVSISSGTSCYQSTSCTERISK